MRILGISAFYHDSAAALIDNGVIVSAAQEERFTRKSTMQAFLKMLSAIAWKNPRLNSPILILLFFMTNLFLNLNVY